MDDRAPEGGSQSLTTVCLFAAGGALLGGADGAAAAGLREAVIFALAGGLIGAIVGVFAGRGGSRNAQGLFVRQLELSAKRGGMIWRKTMIRFLAHHRGRRRLVTRSDKVLTISLPKRLPSALP